ncbi:MAG: hypothetical protein N2578_04225 [Bdellovibrionaceae bacterium]|nr:hypothetical protein [Pseudobdellovibrionaceae bacterium]
MINLLKFPLLLILFFSEIHVRAASTEKPTGCLSSVQGICHIRVGAEQFSLERDGMSLYAAPGSYMFRDREGDFVLASGLFRLKGQTKVRLLHLQINDDLGDVWIEQRGSDTTVRALQGNVHLRLRDTRVKVLPEGFQMTIRGLDSFGENKVSVPEVVDLAEHLRAVRQMYPRDKKKFSEQVNFLRKQISSWIHQSADLYRVAVQRGFASLADEQEREAKARFDQSRQEQIRRESILRRALSR